MTDPSGISFASPVVALEYLSHAAPETVYGWLKANAGEPGYVFMNPFSDELLKTLLGRNDPIINMGVASVATEPEILRVLWRSGNQAVRNEIAANPYRDSEFLYFLNPYEWADEGELTSALQKRDPDFVKLWCLNRSLRFGGLEQAFAKQGIYESLSEDRWRVVVYWALQNPILTVRDERLHEGTDAYRAAWNLLLALPNTYTNASMFCERYQKLNIFAVPYESLLNEEPADIFTEQRRQQERDGEILFLKRVFERWTAAASDDPTARDNEGNEVREFQILRQNVAAGAVNGGDHIRTFIKEHEDVHVRLGYSDTIEQQSEFRKRATRIVLDTLKWGWRVIENVLYVVGVWYVLSQLRGRPENIIVPVLGLIYVTLRTTGIYLGQIALQHALALDGIQQQLKVLANANYRRDPDKVKEIERMRGGLTAHMAIQSIGLSAIALICLWFLFTAL